MHDFFHKKKKTYFVLPIEQEESSHLCWQAPSELFRLQKLVNKTRKTENITIKISNIEFHLCLFPYHIQYYVNFENKRLMIFLIDKESSCILLNVFQETDSVDLAELLSTKNADSIVNLIKSLLLDEKNICFTGNSGTGKYTLMKACTQYLKQDKFSILNFSNGGAIIFRKYYYDINSSIKDMFDVEIHMDYDYQLNKKYIKSIKKLKPDVYSTEIAFEPILLAEYKNGQYVVYSK